MLAEVKLPPATARLLVGSLCLCACTVPLIIGEDSDATTGVGASSGDVSGDDDGTSVPPTTGETTAATILWSTTGGAEDSASEASETTFEPQPDMPPAMEGPSCSAPLDDCTADNLEHALGLGCGNFEIVAPLAVAGAAESRGVTTGLGEGATFKPRRGAQAVVLSTGIAAHAGMTAEAIVDSCSNLGLPCPSTDFPEEFDLAELPQPLMTEAADCPQGQPHELGDCSGTVDPQWLGDPRLAHDYTELRFSAVVPQGTLAVSLAVAFLTAERPMRFPSEYNDFLIVWLESERWTGNIAIHPKLATPIAANALEYAFTNEDPEIADLAFAGHAATDWFRISAMVTPGDTVTLVVALFDAGDGIADSAVLLDDLRWDCDQVSRP